MDASRNHSGYKSSAGSDSNPPVPSGSQRSELAGQIPDQGLCDEQAREQDRAQGPAIPRRAAIRKIAAGAEIAALVAPSLMFLFGGAGEHARLARAVSSANTSSNPQYPKTDSACVFSDGVSFRNVGVMHHLDFLRAYSGTIRDRLLESDVVLLEAGSKILRSDPFWKDIAQAALSNGKVVYCVDNQRLGPAATQLLGSMLLSAAAAVGLLGSYNFKDEGRRSETDTTRRRLLRAALRAVGWTSYLSGPLAPTTVLPEKLGVRTVWDVSFSQDARTVAMLIDAHRIASQHQGQKVLMISGDVHARSYSYYAKSQELLSAKEALYRRIYYPWLRAESSQVQIADLTE